MSRKLHILIVEDEAAIRTGLVDVLSYHGYAVTCTEDGDDGLRRALSGRYDLLLLDVMLPGTDGFTICRQVREKDRAQPIIMLTARGTDEDIIQGLTLGADDYVAKPFSVAQLVLRIEAVLRRSDRVKTLARRLELSDGMVVDTENLSGNRGDGTVHFTRREMEVLQYLAANHDRPVPREELLARVWGYARELEIETRTVDIHIAKIRRKIEASPGEPANLITVRGAGYRLLTAEDAGSREP